MKNVIKFLLHAIMLVSFSFLISCAGQVKEISFITENSKFNFLIASATSKYKDSIRNQIIEKYKSHSNIKVVDIRKLSEMPLNDYDVILIIDTIKAGARFNDPLYEISLRLKDKRNLVIFLTVADPETKYKFNNIDAITSASTPETEESVFQQIADELDNIISYLAH